MDYGEDIPAPAATFLMEIMEQREEIEEESTSHSRLEEMRTELQGQMKELEGELRVVFETSPLDQEQAIDLTSRLTYLSKLLQAIHQRLPSS